MAAGDDDKAWLAAFIRQMSVPGQGADGHFVPLTAAEIETRAAAILAREAEEDRAAPTDPAAERAYVATLVSTLADRIAEHFEAATSDCCCVAEHLLLGAGAGRDADDDDDDDDEREAGDDEAAHAGASPIATERADCADSELLTRQTAAETTPVEVLVPAAAPSHAPAHDRCVLAQWRVLQQQNNPSCGYYVLFNGLHFAAASGAADPATRNAHLAALRDPVAYWRFYWTCYRLLEAECERRGNEFYPWTKAAVATRVMEREYMQLLCERFQRAGRRALLQQIRPAVRLVPVPECRESLTGHLGWERARMLHSHIQHLRRSPRACVLFLLGVVDHWVCLAVNKVGISGITGRGSGYGESCRRWIYEAFFSTGGGRQDGVCADGLAQQPHPRRKPERHLGHCAGVPGRAARGRRQARQRHGAENLSPAGCRRRTEQRPPARQLTTHPNQTTSPR